MKQHNPNSKNKYIINCTITKIKGGATDYYFHDVPNI